MDRSLPALLWGLAVLFVAILVHIGSILLVPRLAPKDAFASIGAAPTANRTADGEPPIVVDTDLPFQDPALASAVCPYDLSTNMVRVTVPVGDVGFAAVSVHSRSGTVFYALTDRASIEGRIELLLLSPDQLEQAEAADSGSEPVRDVRVTSPTTDGFIEFDMLPRVGGHAEAEGALKSVRCKVEAGP